MSLLTGSILLMKIGLAITLVPLLLRAFNKSLHASLTGFILLLGSLGACLASFLLQSYSPMLPSAASLGIVICSFILAPMVFILLARIVLTSFSKK